MKKLLIIPLLLLLTSCWERGTTPEEARANAKLDSAAKTEQVAIKSTDQARDKVLAQASANLEPIAQAIEAKGQTGIAGATRDQKVALDKAIDIPAAQYPLPAFTAKQLIDNADKARQDAQVKADTLQGKLDAAEAVRENAVKEADAARAVAKAEKEKADAAASKAWWLQAGGISLTVLTALAGVAARLGLPGGAIVSALFNVVTPALKQNSDIAHATVAAADVGRSALSALDTVLAADPDLAAKVSAKVSTLTKGKAEGVEDLFKLAAKAYTVDEGKHVDAVDELLSHTRGAIATVAGTPAVLNALLKI